MLSTFTKLPYAVSQTDCYFADYLCFQSWSNCSLLQTTRSLAVGNLVIPYEYFEEKPTKNTQNISRKIRFGHTYLAFVQNINIVGKI